MCLIRLVLSPLYDIIINKILVEFVYHVIAYVFHVRLYSEDPLLIDLQVKKIITSCVVYFYNWRRSGKQLWQNMDSVKHKCTSK